MFESAHGAREAGARTNPLLPFYPREKVPAGRMRERSRTFTAAAIRSLLPSSAFGTVSRGEKEEQGASASGPHRSRP